MSLIEEIEAHNYTMTEMAKLAVQRAEREYGEYCDPVYIFMAITAMNDSSVVKALLGASSRSASALVQGILVSDVASTVCELRKQSAHQPQRYLTESIGRMVDFTLVSAALQQRRQTVLLADLMAGALMSDSYAMRGLLDAFGCDKFELLEAVGIKVADFVESHLG